MTIRSRLSALVARVTRVATPDRLHYAAAWAQVLSTVVVIVSVLLLFFQVRDANRTARSAEANAARTQMSALRSSIYTSRDVATLLLRGTQGEPLDDVDRLRFLFLVREYAWTTQQLWDRAQPREGSTTRFIGSAGPGLLRVICTPGGREAWSDVGGDLPRPFVDDLNRLAASYQRRHAVRCP